jgi:hypothetical protein
MSIWPWVAERRARACADGDRERLRLTEIHCEAWPHRETNPDRMIALFQQGRCLAASLREPWWELYFDYWELDARLHWKRDYRGALDLAVGNVLKSRAPRFTGFPLNFSIQRDLAGVYLGTDPLGYENEVVEALDYLEREFRPEGSDRYLLLGSRRALAVTCNRLQEARDISLQALALMDADRSGCPTDHFAVPVYGSLCFIDARRADWESLAGWARLGEETVLRAGQRLDAAQFLMWQAVRARRARDERNAQRLRRRAESLMARTGMGPCDVFWEASADFHEAGGDLAGALDTRARQWDHLVDRGMLANECYCLLERCRLLARVGQLEPTEADAVRRAAAPLRAPATYLAELAAIEAGDTTRPGERS